MPARDKMADHVDTEKAAPACDEESHTAFRCIKSRDYTLFSGSGEVEEREHVCDPCESDHHDPWILENESFGILGATIVAHDAVEDPEYRREHEYGRINSVRRVRTQNAVKSVRDDRKRRSDREKQIKRPAGI